MLSPPGTCNGEYVSSILLQYPSQESSNACEVQASRSQHNPPQHPISSTASLSTTSFSRWSATPAHRSSLSRASRWPSSLQSMQWPGFWKEETNTVAVQDLQGFNVYIPLLGALPHTKALQVISMYCTSPSNFMYLLHTFVVRLQQQLPIFIGLLKSPCYRVPVHTALIAIALCCLCTL